MEHGRGGAPFRQGDRVDTGEASPTPQSEEGASFQGLVDDEVARIDWKRPVEEVWRQIRGCDPQPGAWCEAGDRTVRMYDAALVERDASEPPGSVVALEGDRLVVSANGGCLSLGKLRVGDQKKGPAAEGGLAVGEILN